MTEPHRQPGRPECAPTRIRLLDDPPLSGSINMARDEALLAGARSGTSPPTLRFYEWSEPTISLGYFQPYAEYRSLPPPAGVLPVVRRLTGGGAILHDRELTYALVLPVSHALAQARPNRLYERVHDALIACVSEQGAVAARHGCDDASGPGRGPFFCFARRHRCDVITAGDKVAGSAQRRTREAILQHGTIIIERRFDQQPAGGLSATGLDAAILRRRLPVHLAERLQADIEPGRWTDGELERADSLRAKYEDKSWTRRK